MPRDQYTLTDPRGLYPSISPPVQQQPEPGIQSKMDPVPDLGENTYRGSGRLKGRKALITGGDSGIGGAVAIAFAREGADVAISYLPSEEEDARHIVSLIEEVGHTAVAYPGDLKDKEYCRSLVNASVEGLKALAQQLGPRGIRVNAVAPGPTWTALQVSQGYAPDQLPQYGKDSLFGRAGQPAELAPAYVFLASAESSFVMGETLNVNGGQPTP